MSMTLTCKKRAFCASRKKPKKLLETYKKHIDRYLKSMLQLRKMKGVKTMGKEIKYEVIVDNEWYFEGSFERCCDMVDNICADPDFWGSCYMVSEEEFFGIEE